MARFFEGVEPERVWYHFEELTKLPHGSGNEDAVRKYLADFAQKHGFDHFYNPKASVDQPGERVMVIYKKAAPGLENKPTVVIQGHMDMVCVPDEQIFPLKLVHCDAQGQPGKGWVKAGGYTDQDGTSLGADNGIGMSIALAILEDTGHRFGPIECFFTVQEEVGMDGARDFNPDLLKGRVYLNLDEETLQTVTYGCAGGLRIDLSWEMKRESVPAGAKCYSLNVSGLKGGHSGARIHEGRANAIKLLTRILYQARDSKIEYTIASLNAGNIKQSNVIPGNARAHVILKPQDVPDFEKLVATMRETFTAEYRGIEPLLEVDWQEIDAPETMMSPSDDRRLADVLMMAPHGVVKLTPGNPELVETSTNLAAVSVNGVEAKVVAMPRSSRQSGVEWVWNIYQAIAASTGVNLSRSEWYPSWTPREDSTLLQTAKELYSERFHGDFKAIVIHAGLECGWIVNKYEKGTPMDCIAFGPNLVDPHSRRERVEIASVAAFYQCVLAILKHYAE